MSNVQKVKRLFKDQDCVISCSCSNEYVPYLSVYLQSLIENADSAKYYDIVVLSRSMTDLNKDLIRYQINHCNISVRFFDPSYLFCNSTFSSVISYGVETYNRIAAPVIFSDYRKIIFTDIDMIINGDILNLKGIDLYDDYAIAACKEPMWRLYIDNNRSIRGVSLREYTKKLSIEDPYDYFNAGLLLIDVKKCLELNSFICIMNLLNKNSYLFAEQCAINSFFSKKIQELPSIWNYFTSKVIFNDAVLSSKEQYYQDYISQESNACIFHYVHGKPWNDLKVRNSELWWKYAYNSPWFSTKFFEYSVNYLHEKKIKELSDICIDDNSLKIDGLSAEIDQTDNLKHYVVIKLSENSRNLIFKELFKRNKIANIYNSNDNSYKLLKTNFYSFLEIFLSLKNTIVYNTFMESYNLLFFTNCLLPILPKKFSIFQNQNTNHVYFKTVDNFFEADICFDPLSNQIYTFGYTIKNSRIISNSKVVDKLKLFSSENGFVFRILSSELLNFYFCNKNKTPAEILKYFNEIENIVEELAC